VAGGRQGTVREIGLFTSLLVTRDGVYVSIPNSQIFGAVVINFTRERIRRVTFVVPVDWVNDLDLVDKTICDALKANAVVLADPAPSAVVLELQEYAVTFKARAYTRSADYWKSLYALQKEVKAALDSAGILPAVNRQAPVIRSEPNVAGNRAEAREQKEKS
jgi:small conductance mechanosensitive channel